MNSPFPELPPLSYFLYSPNNILLLTRLSSSSDVGVDGVVVCKMISFAETAGYRRVEGDIRNKDRCNCIGTPSRTTTLLCVRSSRVAAAATAAAAAAETFIIPPRRRMCRAHMANANIRGLCYNFGVISTFSVHLRGRCIARALYPFWQTSCISSFLANATTKDGVRSVAK